MYAFALVCWSVLAQQTPFADVRSEAALCAKVHGGSRPDLAELPADTPEEVRDMIAATWDSDRSKRKTAAECFAILAAQCAKASGALVDAVMWRSSRPAEDSSSTDGRVCAEVCRHFARHGLTVGTYRPPVNRLQRQASDSVSGAPLLLLLTREACGSEEALGEVLELLGAAQRDGGLAHVCLMETSAGLSLAISAADSSLGPLTVLDVSSVVEQCALLTKAEEDDSELLAETEVFQPPAGVKSLEVALQSAFGAVVERCKLRK
jgi:hypothetical protein